MHTPYRKKIEKPGKLKKKNQKNRIVKKTRPVRFGFGFISLKSKKPNWTEPKLKKNRAKPVWTGFCPKKPNQNRLVWTGFGFFKKKFNLIIFFNKNRTKNYHSSSSSLLICLIIWPLSFKYEPVRGSFSITKAFKTNQDNI